jgi:hypothetical protein
VKEEEKAEAKVSGELARTRELINQSGDMETQRG